MRVARYLTILMVLTAGVTGQASGALRIANEYVTVEFDAKRLSFVAISKTSGLKFIQRCTLRGERGTARRHEATDTIWGRGEAIEVVYESGGRDRLILFEGSPFIVLTSKLTNDRTEATAIERVHSLSLTLDLNKRASELRALGTAGLTAVDQDANPGSYSFLAIADPASRAGVVAGWVSHDRGSGVLFSDIKEGKAFLKARLDYGKLLIEPGGTVKSETLVVGYFADARLGLEAYADAVAKHYRIALPPQPTVYCTWYHAGASNEKDIIENATFAQEHLAPYGFSVVQIDDKWQDGAKIEGPRKDFTKHRAAGPYPSGMAPTAARLEHLGMTPGIWFMPFAGTWDDPFFADRQDMFARKDGKPYVVRWGGTCFDLTNPKARTYVYKVARRIAHDWGYKYFKLDGLWTGMATGMCYVNTGYREDELGSTKLQDPHMTHVQAYRDGLKLVREAAGPDVFILGCNVAQNMRVLGASFGLVDAMRVGPDNGRNWAQICRGPFSGSNTYFLHGRVWYNDPDPIYVRDSVPLEHARALTSWVTLTGQLNASSIQFSDLSQERLHLLQRTMPAHGLRPRPVDLFEQRIPRMWLLTAEDGSTRRDVIGLFNWQAKEAIAIERSLAEIGLAPAEAYVGFDYWADKFVDPFSGKLKASLAPASCRILAVRPVAPRPQVLSTSRHITQGVVDIVGETWHASTKALEGCSRVVGGDPYELRIAAAGPSQIWRVRAVSVAAKGGVQGVTAKLLEQDGWRVRVQIGAPQNCEVFWSVQSEGPR
ncbi:MAG: alpha-galactosidase [Phycisphaerales bacterium]|nr:MAG: alpha-galactosidase [Phycisphaerales bacterium]